MPFYTETFPSIIYYDLTFKKDVKGPFFLVCFSWKTNDKGNFRSHIWKVVTIARKSTQKSKVQLLHMLQQYYKYNPPPTTWTFYIFYYYHFYSY